MEVLVSLRVAMKRLIGNEIWGGGGGKGHFIDKGRYPMETPQELN